MSPPLGMYYRLRAELRKRKLSGQDLAVRRSYRPKPVPDVIMFVRLVAVTGGLLLAVSLIMQSVQ